MSLSTHLFFIKPHGCGKIGFLCEPHEAFEAAIYYALLYFIALGSGGPDAVLPAFIADQFDEEDPSEKQYKSSFYGYYYVALNLGSLVGPTVLVYMENKGYWVVSFWTCSISAVLACVFLLSGSLRYRHFKPSGNPISRFSQVLVASLRKSSQKLPSNEEELYEIHGREGERSGMRRIPHTKGFKFLDSAAIITPEDVKLIDGGRSPSSWHLCTVTQVEEVKCILRLLPIWLCSVFFAVVYTQMLSLFTEQGDAMNKSVFNFSVPPGSIYAFNIIGTSVFILSYDSVVIPIYVKLNKEPRVPSTLQRMGIGLAISVLPMVIAGVVEQQRLKCARNLLVEEQSCLNILWQIPQYVLVGLAEAFFYVGQIEFFVEQTPGGLKSLGISLCMSCLAVGSYVASAILTVVTKITSKDGKPGWVPRNLNDGHLDRFFFVLAPMAVVNFILYVVCAKCYKSISWEMRSDSEACQEEGFGLRRNSDP
ncbi:protein NRT1/ PTR FAMILY 7.3 isoform X2 [Morus notabilis]|nr:protein NRT1/ PTR FAMILY 7.3 isoform X2 [Morus notabilis]